VNVEAQAGQRLPPVPAFRLRKKLDRRDACPATREREWVQRSFTNENWLPQLQLAILAQFISTFAV